MTSAGFGAEIDGGIYIRIGHRDRLKKIVPLEREASGALVDLSLIGGNLEEIAPLLARLLGFEVDLPAGPHGPLTLFVKGVPGDELLELVLASRGWTGDLDGARIRIGVPSTSR